MIMRGLTAGEFCKQVLQQRINDLGDDAYVHNGLVILYSGPAWEIQKVTSGLIPNPPRSAEQAKSLNATRIDDTAIGQFLEGINLYKYFSEVYDDDFDIHNAVRDVWVHASEQFMRSGFREVATSVCGADPDRVFRAHELKVILTEDTEIEIINGVSIQHFKDIYEAADKGDAGFYAAFVEVCRTELDVALMRVQTAPPHEQDEAWEDFEARQLFFDLEQASTPTAATALAAMAAHRVAIADAPSRPPASAPVATHITPAPIRVAHGG